MFAHGRKSRQREEFEQTFLPHLDALYATALRLTRHERDAEDLVQDAILRAFRFFHRFEPGTNAKAWLFKVLTNTFINQYRKQKRERNLAAELLSEEALVQPDEVELGRREVDEGAVLGRLVSGDVKRALDSLPPDFRLAVILADLEDFSYREIADIMDCPVGTVMSRLYRARAVLRRLLRDYAREQGIGLQGRDSETSGAPAHLKIVRKSE